MEEKVDGSSKNEFRKREASRYQESLADPVILQEWFELKHSYGHPKGGKLIKCVKTKNGTNKSYMGREKENAPLIESLKRDKKLVA